MVASGGDGLWNLAEEACDAMQPAIGRPRADVDAGHHDGAVGSGQVPGEAKLVVVHIDAADPTEAVAGEPCLHAGHHVAERRVAFGLEGRIDVAAVTCPGARDVLGPTRRPLGHVGVASIVARR